MRSRRFQRARRLLAFALLVSLIILALGARLAWLQVLTGTELAEAAVRQRALVVPLSPTRGNILDREGTALSGEQRLHAVVIFPAFLPAGSEALGLLARALGLPSENLLAVFGDPLTPVPAAGGLSAEQASTVARLSLPGVVVVAEQRRYPPSSIARHVVGYVDGGDGPLVEGARGRDGLERSWDAVLRGAAPEMLALFVDARGEPIPTLGWRRVFGGGAPSDWSTLPCDVVTTIGGRIQRAVEEVMDARVTRGAVVVMDPSSGDILALASRPHYSQDNVAAHLGLSDGSLMNRALVAYPPGSVLKPLILAAALESGAVCPDETFSCCPEGGVGAGAGAATSACHARGSGGHGTIGLREAMRVSCNDVFIQVWRRLGQDTAREFLSRFGLGATTGTGLPGEAAGRLPRLLIEGPEPETGMGQGTVAVTPVQIARAYSAIASGGTLPPVALVREVRTPAGLRASVGPRAASGEPASGRRVVSRAVAAEVTVGLELAVAEGTGRGAATLSRVAGKTGTAETGRVSSADEDLTVAWFAGFWPAGSVPTPRVVIVVLVEDSLAGGREAAEIFGEILLRIISGDG